MRPAVRGGLPALIVLVSAAGLPAPGTVPAAPSAATIKGADLELLRGVRAIAGRVERVRGEPFDRPPIAVRAPDAMREVAAEIRGLNVIGRERMEARGRAWRDLGFGDEESPRALYRQLAGDLAGIGFDPPGNRLLVSPERLRNWDFAPDAPDDGPTRVLMATGVGVDEPLVCHLLMHVRQRERIGGDWLAETTDATLAAAAWAEGEANLVAVRYLFAGMGLADEILDVSLDPAGLLDGGLVPAGFGRHEPVLDGLLRFVYQEGFAVAAESFRRGGWPAVGAAIGRARATRDVLHPDRAGTEPAVFPEPRPPVEGWRLADVDSLGEHAVFVLVSTRTGKDNLGLIAGDGWLGDRLYRWEPAGGPPAEGGTLWVSRWRTDEDARDFEYAFARVLRARFPGRELAGEVGAAGRTLSADGRTTRLRRRGTEVEIRVLPPAPESGPAGSASGPDPTAGPR